MANGKKTLYERILRAIISGSAGVAIRTHEQDEAYSTIYRTVMDRAEENKEKGDEEAPLWQLRTFDIVNGLTGTDIAVRDPNSPGSLNAESCYSAIMGLLKNAEENQVEGKKISQADAQNILLVVRNGHREIENNGATSRELVMAIMHLLAVGKAHRCHLLLLMPPGVSLPLELRDLMQVIDHELPSFQDRREIVDEILAGRKNIDSLRIDRISTICGGLTRGQVERVCAEALIDGTKRLEKTARQLKNEIVNATGFMTLAPGMTKFDPFHIKRSDPDYAHIFEEESHPRTLIKIDKDTFFVPGVGGCKGFKDYTIRVLSHVEKKRIRPSGALLLGVPGVGKSLSAIALGNELGWPVLMFNFGELMGQYVGQSEGQLKMALDIADHMDPCILYAEEINLAFSGSSAGSSDSGVASRMLGTLLTWLENHSSMVYFLGSCNDSRTLPPALKRPGRLDKQFFFDIPNRAVKDEIWNMFIPGLGLDPNQERPKDDQWAGAEIRACCSDAHLGDYSLLEAGPGVIPTMVSSKDEMQELRRWASGRCIDAATGKLYSPDQVAAPTPSAERPRKMRRHVDTSEE